MAGRTGAIIPLMAKALGSGIENLVDANSGFSVQCAVKAGNILRDHGVCHYEEPVPYWDMDATQAETAALDIDVTGSEQDQDLSTWQRMIAMKAVDIVQSDVMYMGGIARTLLVAYMARKAGLSCTPIAPISHW
jgi:L-alanine-DL-glutamate epimerase-like enolase superfamily enzyme